MNKIIQGDCLEVLKTLESESVDCCVTSPPYWGLRDYNVEGQLGLEKTPEEYVAKMVEVFREVKRVLKKEGTLWLNLGDSYVSGKSRYSSSPQTLSGKERGEPTQQNKPDLYYHSYLKDKDLCGIPWRVAFALQQPYYTGKIKDIKDRIWLAAIIDGEGCMYIHKRKAGDKCYASYTKKDGSVTEYDRKQDTYGAGLEVANCHESIVKKCQEITGLGSICRVERETKNKMRNQPLYRWNMRNNECRDIIREIYPHFVGKKHEARLLLGCPSSGVDAEKAHHSLMALHNGLSATIDFPEPKSMFEDGFYLRQDVIWSKPNCMPESVTDRCTKSHEYVFLLAKSAKYYFDNEAIKEPISESYANDNRPNGVLRQHLYKNSKYIKAGMMKLASHSYKSEKSQEDWRNQVRNKRSVWTITTKPYSEAHFATFPEELVIPMIKAGCPEFVCMKCGKAREIIKQAIGEKLDIEAGVVMNKSKPYAVVEREGYIEVRDLPPIAEIKNYLNSWRKNARYTIEQVENIMESQAPHHWFNGESYPTKEQWVEVKELFKFDDTYDFRMTDTTLKNAEKLKGEYKIILTDCGCNAVFSAGVVLDPFSGAGTTCMVAKKLGRNYLGIELNPEYIKMSEKRIERECGTLF